MRARARALVNPFSPQQVPNHALGRGCARELSFGQWARCAGRCAQQMGSVRKQGCAGREVAGFTAVIDGNSIAHSAHVGVTCAFTTLPGSPQATLSARHGDGGPLSRMPYGDLGGFLLVPSVHPGSQFEFEFISDFFAPHMSIMYKLKLAWPRTALFFGQHLSRDY